MGIIEAAMKGSWEDSVPAAAELNNLRLVAASEKAAQQLETGAIKIPSLTEYGVQRIPTNRAIQHLFATEVVIVDYDRSISYELDADFLVNSINERLTNELGEDQHLLPWPPSYTKPATDDSVPASYLRVRKLKRGQIFSAVASEKAYNWIGGQPEKRFNIKVEHLGMRFECQHSDFSRTGKYAKGTGEGGRGGTVQPSAQSADDVVQALESRLASFASVAKTNSKTEEEIGALREVVERLETATVKGFEDAVKSVERVGDGVIDLTEKSKGFSELQLELQQKMVENLVKLNTGQQPKSPPSEEDFHIRKRSKQRIETPGSESDTSMLDREKQDLEKKIADIVKSQQKEKEKVQPTHLPTWKPIADTNRATYSGISNNQGERGGTHCLNLPRAPLTKEFPA
ncbi:hypothetical protein CYMTET_6869 [Cymbomonas tetramitiformis]|uniref:Uncharacterized protein n=1 Tax=Cymbomonas tetramitiformis TaxID=36881 RepID=A0AAE0GWQ5_9CHLO|nr:hypothetical protein CYMTET_6869 [Cymbomonas tetramitiformis]